MRYKVYDLVGVLIGSQIAWHVESMDWQKFNGITSGTYIVVGTGDSLSSNVGQTTHIVKLEINRHDAVVSKIDGDEPIHETLGGYEIQVEISGLGDRLQVEIPTDANGDSHVGLLKVVKLFVDQGYRVFCGYSGAALKYRDEMVQIYATAVLLD